MVNKVCYLFLVSIFCCQLALAQSAAEQVLDKSIAFHDPSGHWNKFKGRLNFTVDWPDKPNDKRKIFIDNKKQVFSFWAQYEDGLLHYHVNKNQAEAKWNGNTEIPEEVESKRKVSKDRASMYRDYYTYLYGMPMKLKDKGTIIDPELKVVEFYGKIYDRIKVTYDPEVGKDIWYFYFDPQTHALQAYQFFHDESKNDGEYILFEELKEIDKIKIPRIRKWYYNKDQTYLASDILN